MPVRPLSLLALSLLLVAPAEAQPTAAQILDRAVAAYEGMMAGVENYTLTQEVMGFTVTTYFQRVPGTTEYEAYLVTPDGLEREDDDTAGSGAPPPVEMLRAMRARAEAVGSETIGGVRTHGVRIEDFGTLAEQYGAIPPTGEEAASMEMDTATFYFGADDGLTRRAVIEGTVQEDGPPTPMRIEMTFEDYRTVGGMRYPFQTTMKLSGMEESMSAEEQAELRRGLEDARRQFEQLPPAQREMMERMMGDQLRQMEGVLAGEAYEMAIRVTDLRVNEGRPD
jgi:hypothetical protein